MDVGGDTAAAGQYFVGADKGQRGLWIGYAAGIQAGIYESIEATSKFYKAGASYEPKMSAFEVSEKMEGYRSAVRATLLSGND